MLSIQFWFPLSGFGIESLRSEETTEIIQCNYQSLTATHANMSLSSTSPLLLNKDGDISLGSLFQCLTTLS